MTTTTKNRIVAIQAAALRRNMQPDPSVPTLNGAMNTLGLCETAFKNPETLRLIEEEEKMKLG